MDPNATTPQEDGEKLQKLEQDLQNLKQQPESAPPPPAPELGPSVAVPPTSEPVQPTPTQTPSPTSPKSSPLLLIAVILAIISLSAIVVYIYGGKYFSRGAVVPSSSVLPSQMPIESPIATNFAYPGSIQNASPSAISSPSALPTSTATPSAGY